MLEFVADPGTAWLGRLDVLEYLMEKAKTAGATAIKPQWWPRKVYEGHPMEKEAMRCLLNEELAGRMIQIARLMGIDIFFSVWRREELRKLHDLGVRRAKIACSQNTNYNLIRYAVKLMDKVYVSCESNEAYVALYDHMPEPWDHTVLNALFCVPTYPTEIDDVKFPWGPFTIPDREPIITFTGFHGFSDHVIDCPDVAAIAAVALGARMIEKHIHLDKSTLDIVFRISASDAQCPDDVCAVTPGEFGSMVMDCKAARRMVSNDA